MYEQGQGQGYHGIELERTSNTHGRSLSSHHIQPTLVVHILTHLGKTAIRTILGPQYAKIKKAPKVADEEEAKMLLSKILPK